MDDALPLGQTLRDEGSDLVMLRSSEQFLSNARVQVFWL